MPHPEGSIKLPLRQATGFAESLLALSGLSWSAPDFSTLSRRQNPLTVAIPYRVRDDLHLLIDSTGIKAAGKGAWQRRKYDVSKRRIWRKIHIAVDEKTLGIRAFVVTSRAIGDASVLPDLLSQIAPQEELARATADGACDIRSSHDAIARQRCGRDNTATQNARLWRPTTESAKARNEVLRMSKRLGGALWRK